MTTEQLQESRQLADAITDFVKSDSSEPIYTSTVIDNFTEKNINRTKVKLTLWELIAGRQIHVDNKFELTVAE